MTEREHVIMLWCITVFFFLPQKLLFELDQVICYTVEMRYAL